MIEIIAQSPAREAFSKVAALTVKTSGTRQLAADLWDAIKSFRKQAENQKEEIIRPLKKEYDELKKPFDEFIKECDEYTKRLSSEMSRWDREQQALIDERNREAQRKIDERNKVLIEKAQQRGIDPIVKVAPVLPDAPRVIQTQAGTKQMRKVKVVYSPKNLSSLMKDFPEIFDINMRKFNDLAKSGVFEGRDDVVREEVFEYAQVK